jgi:hypothetical protein
MAPPHYGCGLDTKGQSALTFPGTGFANPVPIGVANASFTIDGQSYTMTNAIGYHDKVFGVVPIADVFQSWYAGHALLGDFNLAWIQTILTNGTEEISMFISKKDDTLISACGCEGNVAKIRPFGANSEYPPVSAADLPTGYTLEADTDKGRFVANMTVRSVITREGAQFSRFFGPIVGGLEGKQVMNGTAYFEQFDFQT